MNEEYETQEADQEEGHANEELDNDEVDQQEESQQDQDEDGEEGEQQAQPKKKADSQEKWPKKAENALNRVKREAAQLRAQLRQIQQQQQQYQQQGQAKPGKLEEPQEEQFEKYSDYLKALSVFEARKAYQEESGARNEKIQQQMQARQYHAQKTQRLERASEMAKELSKSIPDLAEVVTSYELDDLPEGLQNMLLSCRNPSLAAYNLISEGVIDELAYMPPHLAAAEISRASSAMPPRQQQPQQNRYQPNPKNLRGTGGGPKRISGKSSYEDIKKWADF